MTTEDPRLHRLLVALTDTIRREVRPLDLVGAAVWAYEIEHTSSFRWLVVPRPKAREMVEDLARQVPTDRPDVKLVELYDKQAAERGRIPIVFLTTDTTIHFRSWDGAALEP